MKNEKPEVYALRKNVGDWQISRRNFLKAAGAGATVLGAEFSGGCSPKEKTMTPAPLKDVCYNVPTHSDNIKYLVSSADGKYLLSYRVSVNKCWDFQTGVLAGKKSGSLFPSYRKEEVVATGYINGRSAALGRGNGVDTVQYYEFPITRDSGAQTIPIRFNNFSSLVIDSSGNVYGVQFMEELHFYAAENDYQKDELLYSFTDEPKIKTIGLVGDEKGLFIQFVYEKGCGVFDPLNKEFRIFNRVCTLYAPCPDGGNVLIYDHKKDLISLVSLDDGTSIWEKKVKDIGGFVKTNGDRVKGLAVMPDGSAAFIAGDTDSKSGSVVMFSLKDGAVIKSSDGRLSTNRSLCTPITISKDGSRLAIATGQTITLFSLPELEIVGCPVDLEEMKDDTSGIEVSSADPVTGESVSYTMPCGAEIPAGAVCTCNCVAGWRKSCVCVGHTCSCDGYTSSYWYPN